MWSRLQSERKKRDRERGVGSVVAKNAGGGRRNGKGAGGGRGGRRRRGEGILQNLGCDTSAAFRGAAQFRQNLFVLAEGHAKIWITTESPILARRRRMRRKEEEEPH